MNQMTPFNFEGNQVRTVMIDNEPHFVGNDVAQTLGYTDYRHAVTNHVNDGDKLRVQIDHAGQNRQMTVINESGVYDLIFDASRQGKNADIRRKATEFRHWVTNDVLPSIRKTGTYSTDNTLTAQRTKRLEIMEANKRIRQATAISKIAMEILNIDDKQRMLKQAAELLIQKSPSNTKLESDARYSTEWISEEIGIDSKVVDRYGRLYGVKAKPGETNKFGEWQLNPQTFDYVWRYNQKGVKEVAEFIQTEN